MTERLDPAALRAALVVIEYADPPIIHRAQDHVTITVHRDVYQAVERVAQVLPALLDALDAAHAEARGLLAGQVDLLQRTAKAEAERDTLRTHNEQLLATNETLRQDHADAADTIVKLDREGVALRDEVARLTNERDGAVLMDRVRHRQEQEATDEALKLRAEVVRCRTLTDRAEATIARLTTDLQAYSLELGSKLRELPKVRDAANSLVTAVEAYHDARLRWDETHQRHWYQAMLDRAKEYRKVAQSTESK
jgi:uncharacterized coiled-coil DUF342 family protein